MRHSISLVAVLATVAVAQDAAGPFIIDETGRGFYRLQDAVGAIGQGEGTIRIAPGRYKDCAVVAAGRIAFQATQPGNAIFDGTTCEGKAALVLRGRSASVDGLVFEHMRVPDFNGAGIRLEKGDLTVSRSIFRDSQQGILTANDSTSTLRVEGSTFSGLGTCEGGGGCAHSLYVGRYGALIVTQSRFERGTGGHYLKSRATKIEVTDSSFDDSQGSATNYMIDLPDGATGLVARNEFVQGKDKENHSAFVTVAPEARNNRSAGLQVTGNRARVVPGVTWATVFVADWSHEPLNVGPNELGNGITQFETR